MYNAQNSTKYFEGTHKEGVKEQTYEQETTHTKFRNVVGCGSEGNVMELRRCLGYFNYIKRKLGISLVVQGLRIHLPIKRMWV